MASVYSKFINSPPEVTSHDVVYMEQNAGTLLFQLKAFDADGDSFKFVMDKSFHQDGTVDIEESGWLHYTPCTICHGTHQIRFVVAETRSDGQTPLSTDGVLTVQISHVNIPPRLLIVHQGRDVTPPSFRADILVEENRETNIVYEDLHMILVTYDIDKDDQLTLQPGYPNQGEMNVSGNVRSVTLVAQNCSEDWDDRRAGWDSMNEAVVRGDIHVEMPRPCDGPFTEETNENDLAWFIQSAIYRPQENFHGTDEIKVK